MIPTNLADVAHVLFLHCNLHSSCLLLCVTLIAVFTVSWFKWLKGASGKRKPELKLNCWFCNEDVVVEPEKADSWRCLHCEQYNGFTEDGDYNQQLTAQFEVNEFKTPTVCSQSDFITGTSVLCESCAENQVLKLRQIAAFVPFSEANYDQEVEVYRRYLENRYSLCDKCCKQVSNYLADQDQKLVSKMTSDQLSLLERLKEKIHTGSGDQHMRNTMPPQPVLPRLLLGLCVCAAIVHVIFGWLLYSASAAPGGASEDVSYITWTVESSFSVVPDWLTVWAVHISACCGCAFCFGGLLAVGKHSLYPVDAVHLLLWLVLTLLTSVTPAAILSWLDLTRGRILIAGSNVLLSLACCLRSRRPRHFTVPTVRKKQINPPKTPVKESSRNSESSDSTKGLHKRHVPPSTLPSPACVGSDGTSQVEHVQQNLESLNLGLTRRSKSTSSVWSLPAVVAASSVSPDSTTGRMSPACVQRSQNVLSPSRLSVLDLDSHLTADGQHVSRSSSPWMQIDEGLHSKVNINRNHKNNVIKLNQVSDAKPYQGSSFQSHRHVPPAADTSAGATGRLRASNGAYRSAFRSPVSCVLPDVGPCDSQTQENGLPQLFKSMGGNCQHHSENVAGKSSNPQVGPSRQDKTSVSRGPDNSKFKSPEPAEATFHNSTPRRSQRIALRGKLPKPWPLKKSLSCSIVCDRADGGRSGFWQTRDFVVSSQVWGRHFTDNAVNSTLVSNLLPVQEVRVGSHVCQTALRNNDERLKCDDLLVKRHPCRHDISHQVTEFSDDDCDESDRLRQVTLRNRISNTGLIKNDLPWTWLLIGALMGASLTTNVFLACQRWWAHAEPF